MGWYILMDRFSSLRFPIRRAMALHPTASGGRVKPCSYWTLSSFLANLQLSWVLCDLKQLEKLLWKVKSWNLRAELDVSIGKMNISALKQKMKLKMSFFFYFINISIKLELIMTYKTVSLLKFVSFYPVTEPLVFQPEDHMLVLLLILFILRRIR